MIVGNLVRRKGRALLTLLGIAIGAAAIVALGAPHSCIKQFSLQPMRSSLDKLHLSHYNYY